LTGMRQVPVQDRTKLLSDHGSGYGHSSARRVALCRFCNLLDRVVGEAISTWGAGSP